MQGGEREEPHRQMEKNRQEYRIYQEFKLKKKKERHKEMAFHTRRLEE